MSIYCSVRVFTGARIDFGGHRCMKKPKVELDGKWYCAFHTPEATSKREQAWNAKYEAKRKFENAKWEREKYDRKAGDACRALGILEPELELPKLIKLKPVLDIG